MDDVLLDICIYEAVCMYVCIIQMNICGLHNGAKRPALTIGIVKILLLGLLFRGILLSLVSCKSAATAHAAMISTSKIYH